MSDVPFRCTCGAVRGVAVDVSPDTVNRAFCYCQDCRAFLHWLRREELYNPRGGTEVVQLARARLRFEQGFEHVKLLRLSPEGLLRWYADCCRTPVANTVASMAFVGVPRCALEVPEASTEAVLGPVMHANTKHKLGPLLPGEGLTARGLLHVTGLLARWWWKGLAHPTPLFDAGNRPTREALVLSREERDALRRHPRA